MSETSNPPATYSKIEIPGFEIDTPAAGISIKTDGDGSLVAILQCSNMRGAKPIDVKLTIKDYVCFRVMQEAAYPNIEQDLPKIEVGNWDFYTYPIMRVENSEFLRENTGLEYAIPRTGFAIYHICLMSLDVIVDIITNCPIDASIVVNLLQDVPDGGGVTH